MSQSSYANLISLILSCSILLRMAAPGLATFTLQNESSLLPPLFRHDPAAQKCLESLFGVEGCVHDIITAFFSFKIDFLGSACCKAIIEIEDICWPKVFPLNPFFPPLIKLHCERIVSNAPPSPTKVGGQQHAPASSPSSTSVVPDESPSPPSEDDSIDESPSPPSTENSTGENEAQPTPTDEQDN